MASATYGYACAGDSSGYSLGGYPCTTDVRTESISSVSLMPGKNIVVVDSSAAREIYVPLRRLPICYLMSGVILFPHCEVFLLSAFHLDDDDNNYTMF